MKTFAIFLSSLSILTGAPPREIPAELYDAFTENRSIPVLSWYWDDTYKKPNVWTTEKINSNIKEIQEGKVSYYGITDTWLYQALSKYGEELKGKKIAIVGSLEPWYESVVLAYGAHPVTIEYNTITCDDPRLEIYTVEEFAKNRQTFDAVLSISSIEHSGLGRYGDPLNPYGDLEAMEDMKAMLNPGGLLLLAVPVCKDSITFNAHRTYGRIRLPMLLKGWVTVDSFGFSKNDFNKNARHYSQPVFVLTPDQK